MEKGGRYPWGTTYCAALKVRRDHGNLFYVCETDLTFSKESLLFLGPCANRPPRRLAVPALPGRPARSRIGIATPPCAMEARSLSARRFRGAAPVLSAERPRPRSQVAPRDRAPAKPEAPDVRVTLPTIVAPAMDIAGPLPWQRGPSKPFLRARSRRERLQELPPARRLTPSIHPGDDRLRLRRAEGRPKGGSARAENSLPPPSPTRIRSARTSTAATAVSEEPRPAPRDPLSRLPAPVFAHVCSYLAPVTTFALGAVSRSLVTEEVWEVLFLSQFGRPKDNLAKLKVPMADASRLQLQMSFPQNYARLFALRQSHARIRGSAFSRSYRGIFAARYLWQVDERIRHAEIGWRRQKLRDRQRRGEEHSEHISAYFENARQHRRERSQNRQLRRLVSRHCYPPRTVMSRAAGARDRRLLGLTSSASRGAESPSVRESLNWGSR